MANPVTAQYTLHPNDGWVQISGAVTTFVRISKHQPHVPVLLTVAATAPTGTPSGGYRMEKMTEWFNGAYTGNLYARISNNSNDKVNISVWAL